MMVNLRAHRFIRYFSNNFISSIQAPLVVPIRNSIFTDAEEVAVNENDFVVQEE